MNVSFTTITRSLLSRFLIGCLLVVLAIPFLIILLIPQRYRFENKFTYFMMHIFYRCTLWSIFVPIKIRGKENIPQEPVIIAANHQSSLDIPLVGALLNRHPHVWFARSELLESRLLRFVLPYFAVIVDVNAPLKAMRSLLKIMNLVQNKKCHLIIFPEGERHSDNEIHAFFGGFVTLARKIGRPVVPVRIFHAHEVYARDAFWAHWHPITVVVGPPMTLAPDETDEAFKQRVRHWFVEQKEE